MLEYINRVRSNLFRMKMEAETLRNPHGELEVHRIELYTLLSSTKSEILRDSETVTIPFRLLPAEAGSLP